MPELPEVEVVRRGLEPHIVGHVFNSVDVLHPRANRGQDAPLDAILRNHQISGIQRRGKYLWCELDGHDEREDDVLFMHLGMSGQLRIGHTDSKHVRIRAHLSGGVDLSFIDQRTFGYWLVAPLAKIDHIGPDPLSPGFDIVAAARKLRTKRTHVKTALLDQTIASGIGNIYADEALWRARVSPLRKANRLLQREAIAIYEAAAAVMT
ncbi:MAG TPA: DNA-formamidopyrimidine glycosylase, partial [Corynebacterium sp.]|nr:DNA-formamidopyrimidine glycosylase [Corynebacterium sp.]